MKKSILKTLSAATFLSALSAGAFAEDTALTIYSKSQPGAVNADMYRPVNGQGGYIGIGIPGYAIIRQGRDVELSQQKSIVKFSDVAALIDPTTVQFKSLTDPKGTKVAEQDYQFDLVSQQKLLEKYIDRKITVEQQAGDKTITTTGILLSTQGGITIKSDDGQINAFSHYSAVRFPELPGGLITKPTLVWNVFTGKPGNHKTEVSYETKGITWWADYNLTFHEGKDAGSGTVDFGSWVSIVNQTGASFKDAKLKLIAGDIERAQSPAVYGMLAKRKMEMEDSIAASASPQFTEKSFFEYHLYTLDTPVTLPDNSTKQLELIPAVAQVPVEKQFIYRGTESYLWNGGLYTDQTYGTDVTNKKVEVFLNMKNAKENGLGVALPAGRVRVSQRDSDGSLEFIGENIIDHTPRNEEVKLKLGNAFDIVGERKQLRYTLDTARHTATEEIEVKIRNQKKQPVSVKLEEQLYRATGWDIDSSSQEYKRENAHEISFIVKVEPEKEQVVHYQVRYHW